MQVSLAEPKYKKKNLICTAELSFAFSEQSRHSHAASVAAKEFIPRLVTEVAEGASSPPNETEILCVVPFLKRHLRRLVFSPFGIHPC